MEATDEPKKRRRRRKLVRGKPGMRPGTLIAEPDAHPSEVFVFAYGPDGCCEQQLTNIEEIPALLTRWPTVWVNIEGLGSVPVVERLGEIFKIHRLALEDVLHVQQRPKVEEYGDICYVVARMPHLGDMLDTEQFSLFLGRGFVLTFQERPGDCLDSLRSRIREGRYRIRGAGPDYLTYAILDSIVDSFFPLLEEYSGRLETLEERLLRDATRRSLKQVHDVKRDLTVLRRNLWPLREAINGLLREAAEHFAAETRLYMRDCADHAIRVLEIVEDLREGCTDLSEFYMHSSTHRMNEVIKVLTVISTIFMPLMFVTSVYGMNFQNMPELRWEYGYFICLGGMGLMSIAIVYFIWRRRWY